MKIISFFNHKGGVGKTTLVHNIAEILASKGQRVLLIDADPQMNLTAAVYGLSTSVDYSMDSSSTWFEHTDKFISIKEYLDARLKENEKASVKIFYRKNGDLGGYMDLISGSINLSELEADMYSILKNRNSFTADIPYKFEQSLREQKDYDVLLIDTSPSASSIVNAMMMMSSDYFIAPVSPSFFSLQAIDNLSAIFKNWITLLGEYQTAQGFRGLSMRPKFLGIVVQMAKRYNGGAVNQQFTKSAENWISQLNDSIKRFQLFASLRGLSIHEQEFTSYFGEEPFIIQKCCDFTPQLRSIAEKAGVPVVQLTQDLCNLHKDSGATVDITKENGQYKLSLEHIKQSYNNIADGIIKLLQQS
jgi:chromosome partitioning protein